MENSDNFGNIAFNRLFRAFSNPCVMINEGDNKTKTERLSCACSSSDNAGNSLFSLTLAFSEEGKRDRNSILEVRPVSAGKMKLTFAYGSHVNVSEAGEVIEMDLPNEEAADRIRDYALNLSPEYAAYVHDSIKGKVSVAQPAIDSVACYRR